MSKQYTAAEWVAVMVAAPMASALVVIGLIPLMLLVAWMRVKMWEWFAVPYFHLPRVSVWLMLAVGLFMSTFQPSFPTLKEDHYAANAIVRFANSALIALTLFSLAWAIHNWVLTGGAQ